jgi:hypothetical protein
MSLLPAEIPNNYTSLMKATKEAIEKEVTYRKEKEERLNQQAQTTN